MAPRLTGWLGLALVGMVALSLWALPPRATEDWFPNRSWTLYEPSPESRAFGLVADEVRRLGAIYQRLEWNDSVEVLARVAVEARAGFLARVPDSAPPGSESELEDAIRLQLQGAGVGTPVVPVGAILMENRFGMHPNSPVAYGWSANWEIFVSRDRESPYCFLVDPEPNRAQNIRRTLARMLWTGPDSSTAPNPVGPCLLHAKYGSPGDGTFHWLRSGGYALGEGSMGYWVRRDTIPMEREVRGFGVRRIYRLSPDGEACVMGRRDACLRAFLKGDSRGPAGLSYPWGSDLWSSGISPVAFRSGGAGSRVGFGGTGARLLYDLEEEFGTERFARFWSSELDVEEAFQTAFGEPVEEWLVRWAQARWGNLMVGPRMPLQATLLSFLTLGLFVGLALFIGRRKA